MAHYIIRTRQTAIVICRDKRIVLKKTSHYAIINYPDRGGIDMNYSFYRCAAAVPDVIPADCGVNTETVCRMMRQAYEKRTALLVFPELCLTGYTCGDLFFQRTLQDAALEALLTIRDASGECPGMLVFVGLPFLCRGRLYNTAAAVQDGKILALIPKTSLNDTGDMDEMRYFSAGPDEAFLIDIDGDDVWFGTDILLGSTEDPTFTVGAEIGTDLAGLDSPAAYAAAAGATVIVNLYAGSEYAGASAELNRRVISRSASLHCGYVLAGAGCGESSTDLVYSGHSLIAESGKVLAENGLFENGIIYTEIDTDRMVIERTADSLWCTAEDECIEIPFEIQEQDPVLIRTIDPEPFIPKDEQEIATLLEIQARGLARRLSHTHSKRAVIGVSGGSDSTLAMLVAARSSDILGWERSRILAVTMPCFGTTKRTRSNAEILAESLGAELRTVDISESVRVHFAAIGHDESDHSVVFENAQARERTQVLMDIANGCSGLVVGTGDLSELALGWATYNGDHMAMYSVNASVPKTLVRRIIRAEAAKHPGTDLEKTLLDILDTPVSPELLPPSEGDQIAQITEDLVGPYELHDFFIYYCVKYGFTPDKIEWMAERAFAGQYDPAVIRHYLGFFYRRFFSQQFKRSCMPDGPKVTEISLSPRGAFRMPSDASGADFMSRLAGDPE